MAEPLRTIASFLQLLKKREKNLSPEGHEYLSFAMDGAYRMRKLLDGLLLYSRAGQRRENFKLLQPNTIIDTVQTNLSTLIEEKKAHIKVETLLPFPGHEITISQLFQNLIANSIKFHHPERPR